MGDECINIPLTQRNNEQGLEFLLSAVGKLYMNGKVPLVSALYPPVQFPVSRGTPSISSLVSWDHSKIWNSQENVNVNKKRVLNSVTIHLNEGEYNFIKRYKVNGEISLPISAALYLIWEAIGNSPAKKFKKMPVVFEKLDIGYNLTFPEEGTINLDISFRHASGYFEVTEEGKENIFLKGKVKRMDHIAAEFSHEMASETEDLEELNADEIYKDLEIKGYEVGEQLRKIRKIILNNRGSKAVVEWSHNWVISIDALLQLAIFHSNEGKRKLQFPKFIQKVVINPLELASQNECVAVFNKFTRSIRSGGIEFRGIKTKELLNNKRSNVKSHTVQFVPYTNNLYQNSSEFVKYAVQLFLENICSYGENSVMLTELTGSAASNLNSEVKDIISSHHEDKVIMNTASVDEVQNMSDTAIGNVLLATDSTVRQALSLLRKHGDFLLARLESSMKLETDKSDAVVAEQCFGNRRWIILKKCVPVNEKSPVIYLPEIQHCIPEDILHENGISKYYLFAEVNSLDEVKEYVTLFTGEKEQKNTRFVFLMDETAPPFSLTDKFYTDQLSLDLMVNTYCNGTWGSLQNFEVPTGAAVNRSHLKILEATLRQKDFHWSYVGINTNNIWTKDQEGFSFVDASGYSTSGQKVMCVAHLEPGCVQMTIKPHLTWSVPDSWSLDDASTVPFAYSLAYYSLVLAANMQSRGKSILIQTGQSHVGQAFIAVSLQMNLDIYATVSSHKDRQYLRMKFPQLQDDCIFDIRDKNFVTKIIQKRNYKGFNTVVNFQEEPFLQMSVNLLCFGGYVLQLCRTEVEQNKTFGMRPFLKGITIVGITPEIMFDMNTVWKKKFHNAMAHGIISGVVQPFDKEVFSFSQEHEILRTLHDLDFNKKVLVTNNSKLFTVPPVQKENDDGTVYVIESNKSCLIVGDKPEDCVVLAEWLVNRGCQNLTICCGVCTMTNLTRKHLQLLRLHHHTHITVVPLEITYILQDAMNLLNDVKNIAPLAAVFMLPVKDPHLVYLFEVILDALEPVKHFVLLMNAHTRSIVKARRRRGLPVLDVKWDSWQKTAELQHILGNLDELLVRMPSETVYFSIVENHSTKETSSSGELLLQFLPSSLDDLEALGDELRSCKKCSLVEVSTRSPCMVHVREVHPVYIIPGLQGPANSTAKALARNLTCPAIIVQIPGGTDNLQENVTAIVKDMTQLQRGGIYNIVGISWGGMYAIEVAKQLQAQGEKTHIFLLDGLPQTNQAIARCLGGGSQLQVKLLTMLLNLDYKKLHKDLLEQPDWKCRVHRALAQLPATSPFCGTSLSVAVESIYSRINTLLNYFPEETALAGEVSIIRPYASNDDNCDLNKFFNKAVNISMVEGNHRTLLENTETAFIISDNISVDIYWKRT